MKKSMYSLILMDDVVREVDKLAQAQNTNRSNLINQILAEYVSFITPEKRISTIFNYIDALIGNNTFNSFISPNDRTMSLKSSLDYKYRPTIKYEVELYRSYEQTIGELKIVFRTQSVQLLYKLSDFFHMWTQMEKIYLKNINHKQFVEYSFENGKITRTFVLPSEREYDTEEIAKAISDYIMMIDDIIKAYLSDNHVSISSIEKRYINYLNSSIIL